jgi:hypothetical protein
MIQSYKYIQKAIKYVFGTLLFLKNENFFHSYEMMYQNSLKLDWKGIEKIGNLLNNSKES